MDRTGGVRVFDVSQCLISFGANLGQPAATIQQAAQLLRQSLGNRLSRFELSRFYRTPPVGGPAGQPPFVNAVAALELSGGSAWDVWNVIRQVEQTLGRVRQERWEARRIDLDILLFDDQRIWTQHFKLPHPRMVMRRFILQPALDVAASWVEPVSNFTIAQLADSLRSQPASIALVSYDRQRDQVILENAARVAQCNWVVPKLQPCTTGAAAVALPEGRWLGLVSAAEIETRTTGQWQLVPRPAMTFLLAPNRPRPGAAWEDVHRPSAKWLGMCPAESIDTKIPGWPLGGPRYLLSTDDTAWAEHEIVAAMEAMDCPVEPLSDPTIHGEGNGQGT